MAPAPTAFVTHAAISAKKQIAGEVLPSPPPTPPVAPIVAGGIHPVTDADELEGREFLSEELTENGGPYVLAPGTVFETWFSKEDRGYVIGAYAGCNHMGGTIKTLSVGRLELKDLASSAMGCADRLERQEQWLQDLLSENPRIEASSDHLVLTGKSKRARFREWKGRDDPHLLIGKTWAVEAVVRPDGTVEPVPPENAAEFVFTESSYRGHTSCDESSGDLKMEKTRIVALQGGTYEDNCEQGSGSSGRSQLSYLGSRFRVERADDTVRLRSPDGGGLDLTAK